MLMGMLVGFTVTIRSFAQPFPVPTSGGGSASNLTGGVPEFWAYSNNIVRLPNGTLTNFPSSTTAGYIESQALFPAITTSNTYSSGFAFHFSQGTFHLQSQIIVSNAASISGSPYGGTVLVMDNTNGFTVQSATNAIAWVDGSGFPTGRVSCAVIMIPDILSDAAGLQSPSIKISDLAFTCASNMAGWFIYSKASSIIVDNCWFGRDGFLNTGQSGYHIGIDGFGGGTNAPLMNGIYLAGQNMQSVNNCYFWALANGVICNSAGGYYSVFNYYDLGIGSYDPSAVQGGPFSWQNPDSNGLWTGYQNTSRLSIGAGVLAISGYKIDLDQIHTLYDNWGIVNGAANVRLTRFIDQSSVGLGAMLTNGFINTDGNINDFTYSIIGNTYTVTSGIANNFASVLNVDTTSASGWTFNFNGVTILNIKTNQIRASQVYSGNIGNATNLPAAGISTNGSVASSFLQSVGGTTIWGRNGAGLTNLIGDTLQVLATNRLIFSSVSSLTNTLGREATAIVTAGTSVALQDTNGVAIATVGTVATLDVLIPMHVNMRLAGTGVSAILY